MKTKLTLSVDEHAVAQAKRIAKRRGVPVSFLFEQWSLRTAASESQSALGARLRGKWKTDESGNDPRLEYLLNKHAK